VHSIPFHIFVQSNHFVLAIYFDTVSNTNLFSFSFCCCCKYKDCASMVPYMVSFLINLRHHRGRDRMIVEFTITYAISAYHHQRCKFEPRSGKVYSIQDYVIKFVSDLRQVSDFLRLLRFLHQ
jgi:hypothetical protein